MLTASVNLQQSELDFIEINLLGDNFPWFRSKIQTSGDIDDTMPPNLANAPFFFHMLMDRSEDEAAGKISSGYYPIFKTIFDRWMKEQKLNYSIIFRACINCVHGVNADYSVPHTDHYWDHNNWIMYLTDSPASTVLFDEKYNVTNKIPAKKYTAVSFTRQLHAHEYPKTLDQRIVLVFTYR